MEKQTRELIAVLKVGVLAGVLSFKLAASGLLPIKGGGSQLLDQTRVVVNEESAVTSAVDKTSPSVVAIGEVQSTSNVIPFNPFNPFSAPQAPNQQNQNNT